MTQYEKQPEPANPPAVWRLVEGNVWQYWSPGYAVYGTVKSTDDPTYFIWEARVMCNCLMDFGGPSPMGRARTFEGAKEIVEVLCKHTLTC